MPLGTLDRDPPPFFRQGYSALSKLAVFSAFAIFLMVADARFKMTQPLHTVLGAALYPVQWLVMLPVDAARSVQGYFSTLSSAQEQKKQAQLQLGTLAQRANQVDQLLLENERLRKLLDLRLRLQTGTVAAQVIYDAADPFSRKVFIDKGTLQKVALGSPVLDESGVIGQVTRVYPMGSEVTLITDRDHAIPVLNTRTGARGVAFGDASARADSMELRYMAANADVAVGDVLSTSGVDGVYPPGLMVAKIEKIERKVDAVFARIYCKPTALVTGALHVLVLEPLTSQVPPPEAMASSNLSSNAAARAARSVPKAP